MELSPDCQISPDVPRRDKYLIYDAEDPKKKKKEEGGAPR